MQNFNSMKFDQISYAYFHVCRLKCLLFQYLSDSCGEKNMPSKPFSEMSLVPWHALMGCVVPLDVTCHGRVHGWLLCYTVFPHRENPRTVTQALMRMIVFLGPVPCALNVSYIRCQMNPCMQTVCSCTDIILHICNLFCADKSKESQCCI